MESPWEASFLLSGWSPSSNCLFWPPKPKSGVLLFTVVAASPPILAAIWRARCTASAKASLRIPGPPPPGGWEGPPADPPCCSPTWRGGAGPGAEAEAEEEAAAAAAQRGNKASLHTAAEHSGNPAAGKTTRGERDAPSRRRRDGRRSQANGRRPPLQEHQSRAPDTSSKSEGRERLWAGGAA